jgi:hypothetical protein
MDFCGDSHKVALLEQGVFHHDDLVVGRYVTRNRERQYIARGITSDARRVVEVFDGL